MGSGPDLSILSAAGMDRRRLVQIDPPAQPRNRSSIRRLVSRRDRWNRFHRSARRRVARRHPTFADADGRLKTCKSSDIEERKPQPTSIMPDNLAQSLTLQEFRDSDGVPALKQAVIREVLHNNHDHNPLAQPRIPGPVQHWPSNLREFPRGSPGTIRAGIGSTETWSGPDSDGAISSFSITPTWSRTFWSSRTANSSSIIACAARSERWAEGLTSEGEFWRAQREAAQPAFHRDRIANYARVMVEFTAHAQPGGRPGSRRAGRDDAADVEIVAKTLFDAEIGNDTAGAARGLETPA